MGHHWTDFYSKEELAARDIRIELNLQAREDITKLITALCNDYNIKPTSANLIIDALQKLIK